MPQTDLPIDQLRAYTPDLAVPPDLATFWSTTLAETRDHDLAASFVPVDDRLAVIDTFDVTYAGFGGSLVRGWLHLPAGPRGPLPAVVEYIGYGGGRGLPHERTLFAAAGYAHFVMDTRGQGSGSSVGDTPDADTGGEPAYPGYMTRGITDPMGYYYRRVFADAVRAVDAARSHPSVDASRVAVTGSSQGGGISIAVAGLVDGLVGVAPDVPFLCDFPRAVAIADEDPYEEIARYLKAHRDHVAAALRTLAYFDGAILGRTATAPALFSVGLMDAVCPPSTVFAAFHHYGGPKTIVEYAFNDHEGGGGFHEIAKLDWLRERLAV